MMPTSNLTGCPSEYELPPAPSAPCILVEPRTLRAMRAALLSARFVRFAVLPVPSRSSAHALAPSRHASTEAAVEGSTASKPVRVAISRGDRLMKELTPLATFLGIVLTVGAVGAYYSSRLAALEERMTGTSQKLEERMAGTAQKLEERMAGVVKEVDATMKGAEKAVTKEVDAKIAGSEKAVAKEIAGFREAADLKVRLPRARACACDRLPSLTRLPIPTCSTRPSDGPNARRRRCRLRAQH